MCIEIISHLFDCSERQSGAAALCADKNENFETKLISKCLFSPPIVNLPLSGFICFTVELLISLV